MNQGLKRVKIVAAMLLVLVTATLSIGSHATSREDCLNRINIAMDNAKALGQSQEQWAQIAANDCAKERAGQGAYSSTDGESSGAGDNGLLIGGLFGLISAFAVFWIAGSIAAEDRQTFNVVKWLSGGLVVLVVSVLIGFANSAQGVGSEMVAYTAAIFFAIPHLILIWFARRSADSNQSDDGDRGSPNGVRESLEEIGEVRAVAGVSAPPFEAISQDEKKRVRERLLKNPDELKDLTVAQIVDMDGTSRRSVVTWLGRNNLSCKDYQKKIKE